MPRRKTQAEVIEQFRAVHGDRYDYSQSVYSTSSKKVDVICFEHGLFSILPGHHINGVGCGKCYFETQKTTKAEFVEKSRKHFGDRYDYSSFSELPPVGNKVQIYCTAHDLEFLQEPRNHQRGHVGCPKCKSLKHALADGKLGPGDDASQLLRKFIEQARAVHDDRYGYEEFEYVNSSTKGRITCPLHGNFHQTPNNHLRGSGCPECARESLKEGTFKQKCEILGIDYWRALKRGAGSGLEIEVRGQGAGSQGAGSKVRGQVLKYKQRMFSFSQHNTGCLLGKTIKPICYGLSFVGSWLSRMPHATGQ